MRSRALAVAALLLLAAAYALLVVGGEIRPGPHGAPLEIEDWPDLSAVLATTAAVGIALASRPVRIPVGGTILLVSAVLAALGPTGLISFYDGAGLATALGVACLVALWLLLTGRRTHPGWSDDVLRRLLVYLTLGVVMVPGGTTAAVVATCVGRDDELCGIPGLVIGAPASLLLWLVVVFLGELLALRRRHRRDR